MNQEKRNGVSYAIAAYALWGILPLYWKMVEGVFPVEILANRIVWAFVFTALVISITKQWTVLKQIFQDKKQLMAIFLASLFIALNWGLYIWAVNSGRIVDASLGYYINPLLAVLLGVFAFREKLDRWTLAALLIAFLGVLLKTLQYGSLPWISLTLAASFAIYGAIKKLVTANSIAGLTLETAILTPFALAYLLYRNTTGMGAYSAGEPVTIAFLLASGIVTAVPLLLFSSAARRLPMSLLGFTQYISPTLSLLIGVFLYHERFTHVDMIAFCFIWFALLIYTIPQVKLHKRSKEVLQGSEV